MKVQLGRGYGGWRLMLLIGLTVLALAIGTSAVQAASAGQPAYDFHGTTVDGQAVSLTPYAGKPLVLIFWASW